MSPQFILTAGHCVKAAKNVNLKDVTVVTGSVQLSQGGYTSKVASIHNDAENGENPDTDIGLIKLIVPLDYDSYTNSIRYSTNLPNMDDFGTVIGWGSARSNETAAVDMLQYMYAYITDLTCNGFYKTKHAICTNNGPTIGVCYGDSGSPLIYNGLVVGVVSRAVLCAKGLPDVYSSTAYNINFIRRILATA
ncbi:chymotrypsin-1-like [Halictus rubicundus]|uniref:chymotrypsin-1-like n=1 Tax=Halictus rubicundus TaxID=77578 RepID=UPI00403509D4